MLLKITLLFIFLYQLFKYQTFSVGSKPLAGFKPLAHDLKTLTYCRPYPILFLMLVIVIILVFVQSIICNCS